MHNLKEIRKDINNFKKKINERFVSFDIDELIELDKKNRELIQKKESAEQEKKILSKSNDKKNFEKSKILSKEITVLTADQEKIQKKIIKILSYIPNTAQDDVPIGKDETFNKFIKKTFALIVVYN